MTLQEKLARWAYNFVMADRWKHAGQDDPRTFDKLTLEQRQFWLDEAEKLVSETGITINVSGNELISHWVEWQPGDKERYDELVEKLRDITQEHEYACRVVRDEMTAIQSRAIYHFSGKPLT